VIVICQLFGLEGFLSREPFSLTLFFALSVTSAPASRPDVGGSEVRRLAVTVAENSTSEFAEEPGDAVDDERAAEAPDVSLRTAFVSALCIRGISGVFIVHLIGAD
jgi:hypothetical protein